MYYNQLEKETANRERFSKLIQDEKVRMYQSVELELNRKATIVANEISNNLVEEINDKYSNTDVLLNEFKTRNFSSKFIEILHKSVNSVNYCKYLDGADPKVFIAIPDGFFFGKDLHFIRDKKTLVSWENEASQFKDKEQMEILFTSILNMRNPNTLVYPEDFLDPKYKIDNFNKYELLNLFIKNKYSMEAIKDYRYISVVYVYDNEDIFGNLDYTVGNITKKNYKFIIIVTYNLYNYVDTHYKEITTSISRDEYYFNILNEPGGSLYELAILIFSLFIIVTVYTILILERYKMLELIKNKLGEEEFEKQFKKEIKK